MVARLLAAAVVVIALAACEDVTGHPRCDEDMAAPILDILHAGDNWTVNCKPNFSSTDANGIRHHAWSTRPAARCGCGPTRCRTGSCSRSCGTNPGMSMAPAPSGS